MKKKIKKALALTMVLSILVGSVPMTTSAITEVCSHGRRTYKDKKLSGGVGDYGKFRRYYWIASSVSDDLIPRINYAFDFWVNTTDNPGVTTSISFRETSVKADSSVEIHTTNLNNAYAKTEFWLYSTKLTDPSAQNWGWNKILVDEARIRYAQLQKAQKTGLIAHELGHAMGLSHQPDYPFDSIMHPDIMQCKFPNGDYRNRPSARDCKNINHIYD